MTNHPLQWFIDRIGKTVYRDATDCTCSSCTRIVENGLLIHDLCHAEYLYDIQIRYIREMMPLNYRDNP